MKNVIFSNARKSSFVKTIFLCILSSFVFYFSACSDLLSEPEKIEASSSKESSERLLYGSIRLSPPSSARALDVSLLTSASVTVSGSGMDDITVENVALAYGKAEGLVIEKIPCGKNRVVSVKSNADGALLRGLVDIEAGKTASCSVSWGTTARAGILYELIKKGTDVSSIESTSFYPYIPPVHESLVNVKAIASDYLTGALKSAEEYLLGFGSVNLSARGLRGWTVQITDISSPKAFMESDSESFELKAYPGEWKVLFFDEEGKLRSEYTKDVKITAGEESFLTIVRTGGNEESLSVTFRTENDFVPSVPTRLGTFYEKGATSFSIWSPDSGNVKVSVKKEGETDFTDYVCEKGFKVNGDYPDSANIYGVTVYGDCELAEYQFYIAGVAVRDPYGKMVKYVEHKYPQDENVLCDNKPFYTGGPSGSSWAGPSVNIVVDAENILPSDGFWAERPALERRTDSVVYEVHVGDFTSSSTWNGSEEGRGKFKGMTESGTSYSYGSVTVKTGLDHLKELGVTHVQIMPMYDFATKYVNDTQEFYNWGYDPVNYNVPEDRYSSCPADYVERIREVKDMVNEFHKNGIRVVMDVVYNHTFANEMFENISSKYYTKTDLSGCGNSVDVSNAMVSRMVRDSLEYWAEVYNIDGFRFDLMAIFTKNALNDWGNFLNNTNPETKDRNLLMQGEPWQCNNNSSSDYAYASAIPSLENAHVGCFAGKWRETLKGSSDDGNTLGYIFSGRQDKDGEGTVWNTMVGIRGSGRSLGSDSEGVWTRYFTQNAEQSVNYLMAHDNLCFYDKIRAAGTNYTSYADAIVKFGHGILLSSQGIPFIHCGDEFLRTKAVGKFAKEAHNSYMWGIEMNQIDWALKAKNKACFDYHKDMIAFRKNNDALRNRNGIGEIRNSGNVIYYEIKNTAASPENAGKSLMIVINPGLDIDYQESGRMVMNKKGAVSSTDRKCEGTGVTVFAE